MGLTALCRPRLRMPIWALIVLAGFLSEEASTANATVVGNSGKIAFTRNNGVQSEVYTMKPDGTEQTNVTNNAANDTVPAWSPDGAKIAFSSSRSGGGDVYVMNADGSSQTRLTTNAASDFAPSWSPDGQKITFTSLRDGNQEIYTMNADGTAQTRLTTDASLDFSPEWSPLNNKIAFVSHRDGNYEIYTMNTDGTSQTRITTAAGFDMSPSWYPDGTAILFESDRTGNREIFFMATSGAGVTQVTNNPAFDADPVWSPNANDIAFQSDRTGDYEIFVNANLTNSPGDSDTQPDWQRAPGPVNSNEIDLGFVPAYKPCGTPGNPSNSTHAPPQSSASCVPSKLSGTARVGPSAYLHANLLAVYGNLLTTANEADDQINVLLTDIRTAGGLDYDPNLLSDIFFVTRWRISDLSNGPSQNQAGTVVDLDFALSMFCVTTTDTTVGSNCQAITSVNAMMPGAIKEGRQQALQMFRMRVNDAGPDGNPGNNDDTLFLQQGLYNP